MPHTTARWLAFALTLGTFVTTANAADWMVMSGYSYHFEHREQYRADNPGIGWERHDEGDWTYAAGYYRNSYDRNTFYAGARWEPLQFEHVRLGVFLGAASGYWTPVVALPMASFEVGRVGLNLVVAPTVGHYSGFIGAEVKFKLD